jgi:His-Xaa-Ser system protein HxsD
MQAVSIRLPKAVFTTEAVTHVAHRYTGTHFVSIKSEGDDWRIELAPMSDSAPVERLAESFENHALDELLRIQIRARTEGLAELLLRTALKGSGMQE